MNIFTKTRILVGAVILLAAINLTILITIGFHFVKAKNMVPPPPEEIRNTRFLTKELNLTDEQQGQFRELREDFIYRIEGVKKEIRDTYKESMLELTKENPNESILDSLSNEIANLHRMHHEITIDHFKKVKNVCNIDQQEGLKRMFLRMMPMDDFQHRRNSMHAPRKSREQRARFKKDEDR